MVRIAYQGEPGAYTEHAAQEFFGAKATRKDFLPCPTFKSVFDQLMSGAADHGLLPIENVLAGTIHPNFDLILKHKDVHIVGEWDFQVRHCLMAKRGTALADVQVVRSHYMALAQCKNFLERHSLVSEVAYDTAGAAKQIQGENLSNCAAIASRGAAELYDLEILEEEIGDIAHNYTRFWVLSRKPNGCPAGAPAKTSIAFAFDNHTGKLYQALGCLALNNIDLTKIENRHIYTLTAALAKDQATALRWGYVFYIDLVGSVKERHVELALESLRLKTEYFRILGSYKSHGRASIDQRAAGE